MDAGDDDNDAWQTAQEPGTGTGDCRHLHPAADWLLSRVFGRAWRWAAMRNRRPRMGRVRLDERDYLLSPRKAPGAQRPPLFPRCARAMCRNFFPSRFVRKGPMSPGMATSGRATWQRVVPRAPAKGRNDRGPGKKDSKTMEAFESRISRDAGGAPDLAGDREMSPR